MRRIPFLGLAALLGLAGCFDSNSPTIGRSESTWAAWPRLGYENKVLLQASPGSFGPVFLGPTTLFASDSATSGLIGSNYASWAYGADFSRVLQPRFSYNFTPFVHPWIDTQYWIDAVKDRPRIVINQMRNPFALLDGSTSWLDLGDCDSLPGSVFEKAATDGNNPFVNGSILRSGNSVYLFTQTYPFAVLHRIGVTMVRLGNQLAGPLKCTSSPPPPGSVSARWIDLPPHRFDIRDTLSIRGRIFDAVSVEGGIYVSYTLDPLPAEKTSDGHNSHWNYVAFIDTLGKANLLDSSVTRYFSGFIRFGNRVFANAPQEGFYEIRSSTGPMDKRTEPKSLQAWNACYHIEKRCVMQTRDELLTLDLETFETHPLNSAGLEGNLITGIVAYMDTVYVSTLSGVFTKPLARFFDAAN